MFVYGEHHTLGVDVLPNASSTATNASNTYLDRRDNTVSVEGVLTAVYDNIVLL